MSDTAVARLARLAQAARSVIAHWDDNGDVDVARMDRLADELRQVDEFLEAL